MFKFIFHIYSKVFNELGDQHHKRKPGIREPLGFQHVITKHKNSFDLHIVLDAIHENQVSLIQGRVVASTWDYDFGDDHSKKPLIHFETTNMKDLDLSTKIPQTLLILLHFVELFNNTSFTFPHLNSFCLKPLTSF